MLRPCFLDAFFPLKRLFRHRVTCGGQKNNQNCYNKFFIVRHKKVGVQQFSAGHRLMNSANQKIKRLSS
jgi:hypothetical protein